MFYSELFMYSHSGIMSFYGNTVNDKQLFLHYKDVNNIGIKWKYYKTTA